MQGNILSVDNDTQFADRKLCLTDCQIHIRTVNRQNLYGPYRLYGPYELKSTFPRTVEQGRVILQVSIMTCNLRTVNSFLRTVKRFTDRTN